VQGGGCLLVGANAVPVHDADVEVLPDDAPGGLEGKRLVVVRVVYLEALRFRVSGLCLSDTIYLLISFRKSTPPQNRQLNILIRHSKQ